MAYPNDNGPLELNNISSIKLGPDPVGHDKTHANRLFTEADTEKEYFNELYLAKQEAAKRKLAYDFRLEDKEGKKSQIKNWQNAKSVKNSKSRLLLNCSKEKGEESRSRGGLLSYFWSLFKNIKPFPTRRCLSTFEITLKK